MLPTRALPALLLTVAVSSQVSMGQEVTSQSNNDWRFAHPKATLVGGVRANVLLQSPILKLALEKAGGDPQVAMGLALAQNMLKGIDDIRFSIVDNRTPTPDALVLVSGTVDPTLLLLLQQGASSGSEKVEFVTINPTTLLLGSGASLKAATARLNGATTDQQSSTAFQQASQITPGHDFWLAGQIPDLPGIPMAKDLSLNLKGFAVGLTLSDNIGLEMAAQTATPAQAEALVKMVREAEAKQPAGTNARPEVSVQGSTARLRVSVPADEMLKAMNDPALAAIIGAGVGTQQGLQPLPVEPPKPAKPVKPNRGTVIIQGLEGGPLEFPIETNR